VCSEPRIPWGCAEQRSPGQGKGDKTTGNGLPISLIYEGLPRVVGEKKYWVATQKQYVKNYCKRNYCHTNRPCRSYSFKE